MSYLLKKNLVDIEVAGELVLYDPQSYQAHCLSGPAVVVFQGFREKLSRAEMLERLSALNLPSKAGSAEDVLEATYRALSTHGITVETTEAPVPRLSRKTLFRRASMTLALGAIVSLSVPTPALASSVCTACDPQGSNCGDTNCQTFCTTTSRCVLQYTSAGRGCCGGDVLTGSGIVCYDTAAQRGIFSPDCHAVEGGPVGELYYCCLCNC